MSMFTLAQAAQAIPGSRVHGAADTAFERVSTDSRGTGPGDVFFALKGERFDAHDFLDEVAARGVTAVVATHVPVGYPVPALVVDNTLQALQALARAWRRGFSLPLAAVTGSNGKTTVKEMISAIFAAAVGENRRLATRGNLNNEIGVPLTLFRLAAEQALAVVELGMNHPGETALLSSIAEPTIALVNNAQREHQEFMATVEAVALEHASVIEALPADGVAVFPADDAYVAVWRRAAGARRRIEFALGTGGADVGIADVVGTAFADGRVAVTTPVGNFEFKLQVLGEHNVRNALAATGVALAAQVDLEAIRAGLEAFEPVKGRLQVKTAQCAPLTGATVIDDTYNANPDSMRAAIAVLARYASPRVLIIGDMGEVGDHGPEFHREIGDYARERGIDAIYALGDASVAAVAAFGPAARHFDTVEALLEALLASGLESSATLLVKGSRFMRMERAVEALLASAPMKSDVPGMRPGTH